MRDWNVTPTHSPPLAEVVRELPVHTPATCAVVGVGVVFEPPHPAQTLKTPTTAINHFLVIPTTPRSLLVLTSMRIERVLRDSRRCKRRLSRSAGRSEG